MDDVLRAIDANRERYLGMLQTACRQPSISTQNIGVGDMAELARTMLVEAGAEAKLSPIDGGNPVVLGLVRGTGPRVLNLYNHYDVQPPEPLELWASDPFGAEIRDGRIWARGVADNKCHLVARICAVDAWKRTRGELPLTVRFIAEGEEEIGSPNLERWCHEHRAEITPADGCIWEGGGKDFNGRIRLSCGLKGICYVELVSAAGANTDMHSSRATMVPNPLWRLVWALGTLKGPDERVLIDGFYDRVRPPTPAEASLLAAVPFDEAAFLKTFGLDHFLLNLTGMPLRLKDTFQPTCTVCGIWGGYTEPGRLKTVLANRASAKVDMRLVPDQDPNEICRLLRAHLDRHGFPDIEVRLLAAEHPAKTDVEAPIVKAVQSVVRQLYGSEPMTVPLTPGSGPMYPVCQALGIPAVSSPGGGHPDSKGHAPNENIFVEDYLNSIKGMALLFDEFART